MPQTPSMRSRRLDSSPLLTTGSNGQVRGHAVMIRTGGRLAAACGMLLLAGCIATGNIDRRASTFDEQVADVSNQGLLRNLARASHEEPVYFLAMNQLSSTGTTDFRVGAPEFILGPHLPAVDKIATFDLSGSTYLDNSTNTQLQMSVLGSKDFYNGLLGTLDLRDVDLLLHQGYTRELIFYLVIEKAKITVITPPGAPASPIPPQVVYNDPTNPQSFALFQYYIKEAMEHGLTTETFEAPNDVASDTTAPGEAPKTNRFTIEAELCYDKALALPADLPDIPKGSFCGDKPMIRTNDVTAASPLYVTLHDKSFPLHDQQLQIDVSTRSIYEIFYYLGRIIDSGKQVELQPFSLPAETIPQEPLIDIKVDSSATDAGGCFSAVKYEGQSYCVPRHGAANTKRVFGILNALLALKQSVSDLPNTQTVRIEP
jgi:hypothetical protein